MLTERKQLTTTLAMSGGGGEAESRGARGGGGEGSPVASPHVEWGMEFGRLVPSTSPGPS